MDMRGYVLSTLTEQIGISMDYKVREAALSWRDKGVLTDEDLDNIDSMMPSYGPTLDDAKRTKQEQNKKALSDWLYSHPLEWKDGELYGVSFEDQVEMVLNKVQYDVVSKTSGDAVLEWHSVKDVCKSFTEDEFNDLSTQISSYVYPYCRYQESIKKKIYSANSIQDVKDIVIDYSTVSLE